MESRLLEIARSVYPDAVKDRRWLHQHPELSYQERETARYIAGRMREIGLEPETGIGGHGVRVVVRGKHPGPVVALRADIDALPIAEKTGLPFVSVNEGVMHACGHDVHTAMLMGAARALVKMDGDFPGTVVLIFQPAEEVGPGGAAAMIEDGVLENPDVDAIFGLHIDPLTPSGKLLFTKGPMNASSCRVQITVRGKGGHAAAPHRTIDPIVAAAQMITALQHVVSRNIAPDVPAVLSIASIHGGSEANVIPSEVQMLGTLRTRSEEVRVQMQELIERIVRGIAAAHGCEVEVNIPPGYAVVVNTDKETEIAERAARKALGEEHVGKLIPGMGGEDFSNFLKKVPGSYAKIGVAPPGDKELFPIHSPYLKVHEEAMIHGVAYWLAVAMEYLGSEVDSAGI